MQKCVIGYIHQKNDSSMINNKRGMARRAKRNSSKRLRQMLKRTNHDVTHDDS